MRVGFFVQGKGPHWDIAKHLVESVKKSMPGVEIWHLTDDDTPKIEGTTLSRLHGKMPMAVRRITHHSLLPGEWLFCDSDCIVTKDVQDVFNEEFDVALTDRKGSMWEKSPYGMVMPYNMGVTFSRSQSFWKTVLDTLKKLPPNYQEWEGDQRVVCEMVRAGYPVKVLPGRIYNFTPEKRHDSIEHASIVHFKGPRKSWIGDYANDH